MMISGCISDFTMSYGLPTSLFLVGLVGGFTHCVGMCSPFILAQSTPNGGVGSMERLRGKLLLPYHLGRMVTYVFMAIILSAVFNLAFLYSDMRGLFVAPILMFAGLLFLVSSFPALGSIFPWVVKIQITKPFGFIAKTSKNLITAPNHFKKFLLGMLLGFMPCGLVISAIMAAATAPSIYHSAFAMTAFALGTMPALMGLSLGSAALQKYHPKTSKRLSQGAMTLSALWLFALAGLLVF